MGEERTLRIGTFILFTIGVLGLTVSLTMGATWYGWLVMVVFFGAMYLRLVALQREREFDAAKTEQRPVVQRWITDEPNDTAVLPHPGHQS